MFHRHQWRVDAAYVTNWNDGTGQTTLVIQCEPCGKARQRKIANFVMTGDQVNNYCMARFNQATMFTIPIPETAKRVHK